MDPSRDLIWFRLGDHIVCRLPSKPIPPKNRNDLKRRPPIIRKRLSSNNSELAGKKDADNNAKIAAYYNNLAEVYSKSNKIDDSIASTTRLLTSIPLTPLSTCSNTGAGVTTRQGGCCDRGI